LCVSELAQTKARLKEAQTNCRNIQDQLDEALQREETLKGQLESEWKTFRLAESQHDAGVQRIEDLSARVEKAETEVEEFKAAATKIVRLVSELFETQSSKPLLDQLRELPNLIEEYVVKKARAYASQLLELVRALYPNHDLAPVGQGMQEDCPLQELPDHVSALDRLMKSLNL
jgi:chromosome segregation ATPase